MKILVIGHNPFNQSDNNGRTLIRLFSSFDKNSIAQLYICKDTPDFSVCQNYFRITDKEIISSLSPGWIVTEPETAESESSGGSKKKSVAVFLRNAAWGINRGYKNKLYNWVKAFNPDLIFLTVGDYYFTHKIALDLSKKFNIPIVNYIVDDFYFNNKLHYGAFGGINQRRYNRVLKALLNGRTNFCINNLMASVYKKEFSGEFDVLYSASALTPMEPVPYSLPIKMSYLGNISWDRYKSLIDIGKVIFDNKLPIELNIYSGETAPELVNPLAKANGVNFNGRVSYDEVLEITKNSHIMVHAEGFSREAQEGVKYSFSTKIADCLCANRPILAYGPKGVASMEYLMENDAALIATSYEELEKLLISLCKYPGRINEKLSAGIMLAKKNHLETSNSEKLHNALSKALEEKI